MLGVSRTVQNGETVAHEFMQIRKIEGGKLVFIAKPSGQNEATFEMTQLSENEVVFRNPGHDFPQSITYLLKPDGNLEASIEGQSNGEHRAITFLMLRIGCLPGSAKSKSAN